MFLLPSKKKICFKNPIKSEIEFENSRYGIHYKYYERWQI